MTANPVAQWNITRRQEEILRLIVEEGMSSKEVGHTLKLSAKTVDVHMIRVMERMGVRTRLQAVLLWARERDARSAAAMREGDCREGFQHCPTCMGFGFVRGVS